MLIKEYRISLPLSVEEYRIAQLYMIQRKSREESQGAGSGVEIITNKPYSGGPGGSGQYTYKIYHIGSHLPSWIKAILPKSALRVDEEAWNAYPYTKTRYKCPFVEKFVLEIETKYLDDSGDKDNVFNMTNSEMKDRVVDYIDIVKDPISSGDYKKEEDPKLYQSTKTKRGPLTDNWREEYGRACRDPSNKTKAIMTAYKLCRVEFKYWGMQTKIERFIHDIGLRKTMLRAHRQAWAWQDEYYGLQLSDIRRLEHETQLALQETMAAAREGGEGLENNEVSSPTKNANINSTHMSSDVPIQSVPAALDEDRSKERSLSPASQPSRISMKSRTKPLSSSKSKSSIDSSKVSDWQFQSLEQLQESSSDEEDEFYDAEGGSTLIRSNSLETLSVSNDEFADARSQLSFDPDVHGGRRFEKLCQRYSLETGHYERRPPAAPLCRVNNLFLIIHGGSMLDPSYEHFQTSKRSDYSTMKATFDTVIKSHYPSGKGQVALRLVPCPHIGSEALNVLSSLSPFGFDAMTPNCGESNLPWSQEYVPLGAVALFSACSPEYQDHVNSVIAKANLVYMDFLQSDEGKGFTGQVCILSDATGSILTYDALCRTRSSLSRSGSHYGSQSSDINEESEKNLDKNKVHGSTHTLVNPDLDPAANNVNKISDETVSLNGAKDSVVKKNEDVTKPSTSWKNESSKSDSAVGKDELERQTPKVMLDVRSSSVSEHSPRQQGGHSPSVRLNVTHTFEGTETNRRTSTGSQYETLKFDFEVADFFMLGSPLGLVLAYRRLYTGDHKMSPERPDCLQMYNLFHASDPSAFRIEPLVNFAFKQIPPIKICRFNKFPMGDGESIQIVSSKWWGAKRLDFMLYCPEVLHSFPVRSLPPLFHASFWESTDVVAFVLRQVLQQEFGFPDINEHENVSMTTSLSPSDDCHPKEKWQKRRTMYKVRNLQPNHRGNYVMVLEDKPQMLTAKFMYGPLDMTSLSGEKTDIHILSPTGEWMFMGTEITDGHGKLTFTLPKDKQLSQGIYPVKMVVRVDHTTADLFLAVLPPRTETVVFSIDGSFTASVSIMGKDPKVKAGAVDVVRHWQELGYLILYVTARPDMQHNKVVAWLAQHNFPHGMVVFMDGFSKEPLRQKFAYLKQLQTEADLSFRAGYGSSKDINGYKDLGLKKEQIFIVGKSSKKQQGLATFISSGYAIHLEDLMTPLASRPASGNGVFLMRKGCFSLSTIESKRGSKIRPGSAGVPDVPGFIRQESFAQQILIKVGEQGNTLLESVPLSVRARGTSPRPKIGVDMPR